MSNIPGENLPEKVGRIGPSPRPPRDALEKRLTQIGRAVRSVLPKKNAPELLPGQVNFLGHAMLKSKAAELQKFIDEVGSEDVEELVKKSIRMQYGTVWLEFPPGADLSFSDRPNLTALPENIVCSGDMYIRNCPQLTKLPKGLHVRTLQICDQYFESLGEGLQCDMSLQLINVSGLKSIEGNVRIGKNAHAEIYILECPNLQRIGDVHMQYGGKISVSSCDAFVCLPDNLVIHVLEIEDCKKFSQLPSHLGLLGFSNTHALSISKCPLFKELPQDATIQGDTKLEGCSGLLPLSAELNMKQLILLPPFPMNREFLLSAAPRAIRSGPTFRLREEMSDETILNTMMGIPTVGPLIDMDDYKETYDYCAHYICEHGEEFAHIPTLHRIQERAILRLMPWMNDAYFVFSVGSDSILQKFSEYFDTPEGGGSGEILLAAQMMVRYCIERIKNQTQELHAKRSDQSARDIVAQLKTMRGTCIIRLKSVVPDWLLKRAIAEMKDGGEAMKYLMEN